MTNESKRASINYNLLPVLKELLRTRNVTRAAEVLGMSQPAASEALKRLRAVFEDDLLVRSSGKMVPTPFAEALMVQIEKILDDCADVFNPPLKDIRLEKRQISIATADSVSLPLGPTLINMLPLCAPNISVQFVDLQWVNQRALEAGELDFIIMPEQTLQDGQMAPTPDDDRLHKLFLFEEEFVCIARKGSNPSTEILDEQALSKLSTVAFRADPISKFNCEIPAIMKMRPMFVSQFSLIPILVSQSDAVAMLPRHMAEKFESCMDVEILPWSLEIPKTKICAFWAEVHENDIVHRWFRELLTEWALQLR